MSELETPAFARGAVGHLIDHLRHITFSVCAFSAEKGNQTANPGPFGGKFSRKRTLFVRRLRLGSGFGACQQSSHLLIGRLAEVLVKLAYAKKRFGSKGTDDFVGFGPHFATARFRRDRHCDDQSRRLTLPHRARGRSHCCARRQSVVYQHHYLARKVREGAISAIAFFTPANLFAFPFCRVLDRFLRMPAERAHHVGSSGPARRPRRGRPLQVPPARGPPIFARRKRPAAHVARARSHTRPAHRRAATQARSGRAHRAGGSAPGQEVARHLPDRENACLNVS